MSTFYIYQKFHFTFLINFLQFSRNSTLQFYLKHKLTNYNILTPFSGPNAPNCFFLSLFKIFQTTLDSQNL